MTIISLALAVFLINIPFGYWRGNTRKFSIQWVLAIHVPVIITIALRLLSGLGFQLITFPLMIAAFFSGQYFGGKIFSLMKKNPGIAVTSCLVMDIIRRITE